jgi:lysophospholipase L1-like esterase
MLRRSGFVLALGLVSVVASACAGTNPTTTSAANGSGKSYVYVAIGENGAGGFRNPADLRSSWAQMFYASALGVDGTFYDFSSAGETVADALRRLLPEAQAVRPNLVTVWVSAADIVSGTAPAAYGEDLGQLVRALRLHGATVLLANAAPAQIDSAFDSCPGSFSSCRLPGSAAPAPPSRSATVSEYNDIIAETGHQTGAIVVDVHNILADALREDGAASVLSPGRTSLSARGSTLVAQAFLAQLPKQFKKLR